MISKKKGGSGRYFFLSSLFCFLFLSLLSYSLSSLFRSSQLWCSITIMFIICQLCYMYVICEISVLFFWRKKTNKKQNNIKIKKIKKYGALNAQLVLFDLKLKLISKINSAGSVSLFHLVLVLGLDGHGEVQGDLLH